MQRKSPRKQLCQKPAAGSVGSLATRWRDSQLPMLRSFPLETKLGHQRSAKLCQGHLEGSLWLLSHPLKWLRRKVSVNLGQKPPAKQRRSSAYGCCGSDFINFISSSFLGACISISCLGGFNVVLSVVTSRWMHATQRTAVNDLASYWVCQSVCLSVTQMHCTWSWNRSKVFLELRSMDSYQIGALQFPIVMGRWSRSDAAIAPYFGLLFLLCDCIVYSAWCCARQLLLFMCFCDSGSLRWIILHNLCQFLQQQNVLVCICYAREY